MGAQKDDSVEKRFAKIIEARKDPSNLRAPTQPPPWLDKESARRGRQVYRETTAAISLSSMEALLMGMCIPNFYKPLIFSRQSHSQESATQRYLDTAALVYSWYSSDCWEEESLSSSMIRRVNALHRFIAGKVRPLGLEGLGTKVKEVFKDSEVDPEANLTAQDKIFLANVEEVRQQTKIAPEFWKYVNDSAFFSETDMTLVQGAFFGQVLMYPEHYGAGWLSQQQVGDFLHFWRVNGWYLGVKDENNAALESVEETREMAKMVLERILKPCMLFVCPDSLHMAKAALFPGMDYHVVAYTNYELVGLPLPKLWASFSILQVIQYYTRRWYCRYIYPLPGVRHLANWLGDRVLKTLLETYRAKGKSSVKGGIRPMGFFWN